MASIIVTWEKMGSEFTYEIFYSKNEIGPWIRHHDTRITDDNSPYTTLNTYTLDGLDTDTIYHVKVACIDKYHQQWYNYTGFGSVEQAQGVLRPTLVPTGNTTIGFSMTTTDEYGFGYGPFGEYPFG